MSRESFFECKICGKGIISERVDIICHMEREHGMDLSSIKQSAKRAVYGQRQSKKGPKAAVKIPLVRL